ncbi:acyltransferase family protein [Phycicoccus jejuensis]|uniref:acyltransferase family protein n=1 Tax=Phycicoccus jejuensis TaxID=367299 RepID=UPI0014700391|nr:acyltransferase [Phycicoccus jejuensis]
MPGPSPSRRNDVEGLRALAVLLVVAYHVWFGRVSGGVDVFLLVSAFFLTGGLVRRLERGERVSPPRGWARIFSRLVPTAAVVVTATVGAALLLLPAPRWRSVLVDGIGSMTYSENWVLAHRAVDYYAADKGSASPLQHMWSLSVQGQLFLVWPLLVLACAAVARRTRRVGVPAAVVAALAVVTLASFAWSVHTTATRQSFAYFDTTARLWELGLGGLLAVLVGGASTRRAERWFQSSTRCMRAGLW